MSSVHWSGISVPQKMSFNFYVYYINNKYIIYICIYVCIIDIQLFDYITYKYCFVVPEQIINNDGQFFFFSVSFTEA